MENLEKSVKVLANNREKFRTITVGKFQIRHSPEHVPASLEALMSDLCKDKTFTFPLLKQFDPYRKLSARQKVIGLKLLKRKGVCPYEYFSSYESIKNAQFPQIAAFYSSLRKADITPEDDVHGKKVFKFFKCKNMDDYMKLYGGLDVILLAEIFVKYSEMVINHFELDPIYSLGIPGLSFDIMLKMFYDEERNDEEEIGLNLEAKPPGSLDLFHDLAMEQIFTIGIRGCQGFIATRHAEGEADPRASGKHLPYVDGIIFTSWKKKFVLKIAIRFS